MITRDQRDQLIGIFTRIQKQFDFFEAQPSDMEELQKSVSDICTETIDSLRKNRI